MAIFLVSLLALVGLQVVPSVAQSDCQALADQYLEKHHKEAAPYTGSNMVYFLHVPRTAGRTFHSCLLKVGTHPAKRCPKAYDHLRINFTLPNCKLLSSHDDFSVVAMLPEDTAVLSQVRDPVDRFLSAYEFAIEVAARALHRPKSFRKKPGKIATEDVWPWSYLIPFFLDDMRTRVAALQSGAVEQNAWIKVETLDGETWYYSRYLDESRWNLTDEELTHVLPPIDPYNNRLVMPLEEFAKHPIAEELLHNGATFQVLGVTNYSHWGDAQQLRECVWKSQHAADALQQVALNRIKRFVHVGTTDKLYESAAAAAAALGFDMAGAAYSSGEAPDPDARPHARQLSEEAAGATAATVADGSGTADTAAGTTAGATVRRQLLLSRQRSAAADIAELAKSVREARQALQSSQKELVKAMQAGRATSEIDDLKKQVEDARTLLIASQDKLIDARAGVNTERTTSLHQGKRSEVDAAADPDFRRLPNTDLGTEFQRCANRAQQRSGVRREQSLSNLAMPDGRWVQFTKAARKNIPKSVIDYIRSRNMMDTALHQLGLQLLADNTERLKAKGLYKELKPIDAPKPHGKRYQGRIPRPRSDADHGDELRRAR